MGIVTRSALDNPDGCQHWRTSQTSLVAFLASAFSPIAPLDLPATTDVARIGLGGAAVAAHTTECMTDLEQVLLRLGLSQYLEQFFAEGFEDWETVLDITEADL